MTFQAYIHPNENVPDDAREAYQIGREVTREALLVAGANRPITIGRKVLAYAESVAPPLRAEIADLKTSVVAFGAVWAVQYARDYGLPDNHLHPTHYDILLKAGARMDQFVRADIEIPPAPAAEDIWDSLRGAAPDATGTQSSEDFVRDMREAWDSWETDGGAGG